MTPINTTDLDAHLARTDQHLESVEKAVAVARDHRARLLLARLIADLGDLPDGAFLTYLVWDEDTNDDGTIDVTADSVHDANGTLIRSVASEGIPAGRHGGDGNVVTAWDVFCDEGTVQVDRVLRWAQRGYPAL